MSRSRPLVLLGGLWEWFCRTCGGMFGLCSIPPVASRKAATPGGYSCFALRAGLVDVAWCSRYRKGDRASSLGVCGSRVSGRADGCEAGVVGVLTANGANRREQAYGYMRVRSLTFPVGAGWGRTREANGWRAKGPAGYGVLQPSSVQSSAGSSSVGKSASPRRWIVARPSSITRRYSSSVRHWRSWVFISRAWGKVFM